MGETRVDLVHLLEDLRDAYPGSLEETILTEIVANALDSGARRLDLGVDASASTVLAVDDGAGMTKRQLARYHDLASTEKRRGKGIGFAGVGIKLGLLACAEVVTETRRGQQHAATSWRIKNRNRAPWSWIQPLHLVEREGTAVLLKLSNPLSPLLDRRFLETTVLRHFQPLFEPELLDILSGPYPDGFSISIGGDPVVGPIRPAERHPLIIRVGRQRKPSGTGYLARHDEPLPEDERGLAISTLGKVIRRGWDWVGVTPSEPDRIEGLVEVPPLAEALTLNKGDFLRTGARGALFLSYRRAIQEAVAARFESWGATPPAPRRRARTRPIERDLRKVLGDLAEEYPVLATLAERRAGGQRKLPLGDPRSGAGEWGGSGEESGQREGDPGQDRTGAEETSSGGEARSRPSGRGAAAEGDASAPAPPPPDPSSVSVTLPRGSRRRARATLSLDVRFESLPDELSLGRLVESTVWVNEAHPAYRRALRSKAEGYHIALAVASALVPLTVEPAQSQEFVSRFLARWGEAAEL